MKKSVLFNFLVDKEQKQIKVERSFSAPLNLVWSAWTEAEILDQWWAPKPYRTETKSMDFREGGLWLYSMVSPEGDRHYCRADYKTIQHQKQYSALDAFCDEDGNINQDFPRMFWTNSFTEQQESTVVNIVVQYDALEDLEKIVEMGFKEGFAMAMDNLDELILNQKK